ncbi:MAG: RNA polymerase sigma factor [Candidatus Competibacteraceae bacterium]|nr:RNA polymerase sigma factor [Candidatus Competibacteraceae bacterium]
MNQDSADEHLMLRYRDGDTRAFELLYTRHKGSLYRYLLRQCSDAAVAEELFQDIWLKVINARSRYTVKAKFSTYLYHLAHNRLIDHYRTQQGRGIPASYTDSEQIDPEQLASSETQQPENISLRQQQAEHLLNALAELPEAQRETFLLKAEGGLSLDEIATATAVNRETAKSRLRYAVSRLKTLLGAQP